MLGRPEARPTGLGGLLEAELIEAAVKVAASDQVLVLAGVDDATHVHDDDRVGEGDGGHPMSNHQGRAAANELLERFVNELFTFEVDLAGGFVEDQEFWIPEDCAGE